MFWMSAFLDLVPERFAEGVAFWRGVTGYELSPARGADREFATLVPPDGDDYLRVQRLGEGASRIHLDLHVDGPVATARLSTRCASTSRQPSTTRRSRSGATSRAGSCGARPIVRSSTHSSVRPDPQARPHRGRSRPAVREAQP